MSTQPNKKSPTEIQGERLKALLKKKGQTAVGLAPQVFVSQNTVTNWFKGKSSLTLDEISNIANVLRMEPINLVAYLLGEDTTDLSYYKLVGLLSNVTTELFGRGLAPGDKILECVMYSPVTRSKIYPRDDEVVAIRPLFFEMPDKIKDEYYTVKGNLYRKIDFLNDYHSACRCYIADISIYDYVNEGNSVKELKNAYEIERYSMGLIGALSADYFYLLNYIIGHFTKDND